MRLVAGVASLGADQGRSLLRGLKLRSSVFGVCTLSSFTCTDGSPGHREAMKRILVIRRSRRASRQMC
jgi:hypothetical protein